YIFGHGNWMTATCGGVNGQNMAKLLLDGGLRSVKLISVIACRGAYLYSRTRAMGAPGGYKPRLGRRGGNYGERDQQIRGTYWYKPEGTSITHRFADGDVVHEVSSLSDTGILHCFAGDLHKFLGRGFALPWQVRGPIRKVRTTVYGRVGSMAFADEEDDEA